MKLERPNMICSRYHEIKILEHLILTNLFSSGKKEAWCKTTSLASKFEGMLLRFTQYEESSKLPFNFEDAKGQSQALGFLFAEEKKSSSLCSSFKGFGH